VIHKTHLPAGPTWAATTSLLITLIVILILFLGVFVGRTG
jgi:hypothetical protein